MIAVSYMVIHCLSMVFDNNMGLTAAELFAEGR